MHISEEFVPSESPRQNFSVGGSTDSTCQFFKHSDLINPQNYKKKIRKKALVNELNLINFREGYLYAHFHHHIYDEDILVKVYPDSCSGSELICRISEEDMHIYEADSYQLLNLLIDKGRSAILIPSPMLETKNGKMKFLLAEESYYLQNRQHKRYKCSDVKATITQNSLSANCELIDFGPESLKFRNMSEDLFLEKWFNPDVWINVLIQRNGQNLFSGICECVRSDINNQYQEIVLKPINNNINRFEKKLLRSPRQVIKPTPRIVFKHPFMDKIIQRNIVNISTSGFSVIDDPDDSVFIAGMIIPELRLQFAGNLNLNCIAQVIYQRNEEQGNHIGLAILDIDINNYSRLTDIVSQCQDSASQVCSELDLDSLWEFFFKTGFIYPNKYRLIKSHKNEFKDLFKTIYGKDSELAKYFIYQKNGQIQGHASMVRAYDRAWMFQHHAALKQGTMRIGFKVLLQVMQYLNDIARLPSCCLDHIFIYYRPTNRFPDRVFGDFTRYVQNPRISSLDLFTYLPYPTLSLGTKLHEGWKFRECSPSDLWQIKRFYKFHSGGLLFDILNLEAGSGENGRSVEKAYQNRGLLRTYKAFSLVYKDSIQALLIMEKSEKGLSLSELLNCVRIIILNPELKWDVLSTAVNKLINSYHSEKVPIMIYPHSYADQQKIPYEKHYQLFILNLKYSSKYFEYMRDRYKINFQ